MTLSDDSTDYCQYPRNSETQDDAERDGFPCREGLLDIAPTDTSRNTAKQATSEGGRTIPDDRDVYIALKNARPFQKSNAPYMKDSRIESVIRKRQEQNEVKNLVDRYGMEALRNSVKDLLEDGVFGSTANATARFPDLFPGVPTEEGPEGEVIETDVQGETTKLQPAVGSYPEQSVPMEEAIKDQEDAGGPPELQLEAVVQSCQAPVDLPFSVQYKLLVQLQKHLEQACYIYGQKEMQDLLRERGWDCAEAVELHSWMEEFSHRHKTFDTDKSSETIEKLFRSVAEIRHAAVRRTRTDSAGIKRFLLNAGDLVKILDVDEYHVAMNRLRLEVERALAGVGRDKGFLQTQLNMKLLQIARERQRLDMMEKIAIAKMDNDTNEYRAIAGSEVMKAMEKAERAIKQDITF